MVIARKLLLPTLILFALVLAGVVVFLSIQARTTLENEENRYLLNLTQAFEQDLRAKTEVSMALAKQIAGNSSVANALDETNRLSLLAQTLNAYNSIQPIYRISQQQFVVSPATVLLRLQQTDKYGDSLAASRLTLVNAIALGQDVSGLELDADGLGLRGVAYLEGEQTRGAVDIGITLDQASLLDLKNQYGSDWQLHLNRQTMQIAGFAAQTGTAGSDVGPYAGLALIANTQESGPIFAPETAYEKAMDGQTVISRLQVGERSYGIISMPLRDFSTRVVGVVDIITDRTDAVAAIRSQIYYAAAASLAGLILIGILLSFIITRMLNPVRQLTQVTQTYAEGDLTGGLPANLQKRLEGKGGSATRLDEVDRLAKSFDRMANQLRRLVGNLEERVNERTHDLEERTNQLRAVAEITRDVTVVTNVQAVLDQAVQLARQRFDFYHAGVFLIDESGEFAVLQAATGEAGRRMVEAGHKLRVGQVGIVGSTTGSAKPHVSQDVDQDPSYYKNPNLPDTRSEAALPMRLGPKVIGALDVQSDRPNAFSEGELAVLQILADQLAIAVNNARLIQQLNRNLEELEQAYRSMTRQTWSGFIHQKSRASGYRYVPAKGLASPTAASPTVASPTEEMEEDGRAHRPAPTAETSLQPLQPTDLGHEAEAALVSNQPVTAADGTAEQTTLAVPIRLRDQAIGVINLRFEGQGIAPDVIEMVNDVGSRLGLVLESARLLHEAQRLASREQQINLIATQMRSSVNLDAILQNTVRELGKALGAQRTFIQLSSQIDDLSSQSQIDDLSSQADDGQDGSARRPAPTAAAAGTAQSDQAPSTNNEY